MAPVPAPAPIVMFTVELKALVSLAETEATWYR